MSPRRGTGRRAAGLAALGLGVLLASPAATAGAPAGAAVSVRPAALQDEDVREAAAPELAGRVVRGVGGAGIAGATVELHRVTTEGGAVVDSAISSADGSFRFPLPEDEGRPIFLAAARHQGVRYFGPALHAGFALEEPYEIGVYDTTAVAAPPSDLRVASRHVVVAPGEEGLEVAEVIDILTPGDRTVVAASDTLALWSTALPDDAVSPRRLEGGIPGGAVSFDDGRVLLRSMVSPMGIRVSYTYGVDDDELELGIEHPTDRLDVVVAGAEAEVEGATHAETSSRSGRVVHRYEASRLDAGDNVRVRVLSPGGIDRWVVIWALIGVGLLAAAAVVAFVPRAAPSFLAAAVLALPGGAGLGAGDVPAEEVDAMTAADRASVADSVTRPLD